MKKKSLPMSKFRLALQRIVSVQKDEVNKLLVEERAKRKRRKSHDVQH